MSHSRTVAIFGATGQTGRVVVRHLLSAKEHTAVTLHVYVRSAKKLREIFPDIESDPRVKVFEGPITNVDLVQSCCLGADTIICTLGENENLATVTVLEDAADSILAALQRLKTGDANWQGPKMFLLSSSTFNAQFAAARPPIVHWMIKTAFSYPYADLARAQSKLMTSTSLLSVLLVQPPLLVEEEGSGYEISTEAVRLAVSYEDLGAAFSQVVLDRSYRSLTAVGVSSRLGDRPLRYAPEIFRRIFWGLLAHVKYFLFPPGNTARKIS